jgi:LysM repeat protein
VDPITLLILAGGGLILLGAGGCSRKHATKNDQSKKVAQAKPAAPVQKLTTHQRPAAVPVSPYTPPSNIPQNDWNRNSWTYYQIDGQWNLYQLCQLKYGNSNYWSYLASFQIVCGFNQKMNYPVLNPNNMTKGRWLLLPSLAVIELYKKETDDRNQFLREVNNVYIVEPGDTPQIIARKNLLDLNILYNVNPGTDWTRLYVGQALQVPRGSYRTQAGDTLSGIARKLKLDLKILVNYNQHRGINENTLLPQGLNLLIPLTPQQSQQIQAATAACSKGRHPVFQELLNNKKIVDNIKDREIENPPTMPAGMFTGIGRCDELLSAHIWHELVRNRFIERFGGRDVLFLELFNRPENFAIREPELRRIFSQLNPGYEREMLDHLKAVMERKIFYTYSDSRTVPTIGFGANLRNPHVRARIVAWGYNEALVLNAQQGINRDRVEELLQITYENAVLEAFQFLKKPVAKGQEITDVTYYSYFSELKPAARAAVVDMSFNMGSNLLEFKELQATLMMTTSNKIAYQEAADCMTFVSKAGQKKLTEAITREIKTRYSKKYHESLLTEMNVAIRDFNRKEKLSGINQFLKKYKIEDVKFRLKNKRGKIMPLSAFYSSWYVTVGNRAKNLIRDVRLCTGQ